MTGEPSVRERVVRALHATNRRLGRWRGEPPDMRWWVLVHPHVLYDLMVEEADARNPLLMYTGDGNMLLMGYPYLQTTAVPFVELVLRERGVEDGS